MGEGSSYCVKCAPSAAQECRSGGAECTVCSVVCSLVKAQIFGQELRRSAELSSEIASQWGSQTQTLQLSNHPEHIIVAGKEKT